MQANSTSHVYIVPVGGVLIKIKTAHYNDRLLVYTKVNVLYMYT